MNSKKLIGTIIGVIAFAALIVGATYAYLNSVLSVQNNIYNTGTMHFLVDYTKGSDIVTMPKLLSTPTAATADVLTVKAGLASGSTPGKMTIYLNTTSTSNTYITGKYLNYSWCEETCDGTEFADNKGAVEATGRTTIASNIVLSSTKKNYNIYFWTDDTKDISLIVGNKYSGYIEAIATQTETE